MESAKIEKEKEGAKEWYNLTANDFHARYLGDEGEYLINFEDVIYDKLADYKNKKVLDLGTGTGRYANRIAQVASEIYGIDLSENMIQIANSNKNKEGNVHFEVGDATKLRFASEEFDIAISVGMFEYLQDVSLFLLEINRVLKKGGICIFSCHRKKSNFVFSRIYSSLMGILTNKMIQTKPDRHNNMQNDRNSFYEKVFHHPKNLILELKKYGFNDIQFKTTFFKFPTFLFYFGCRIKSRLIKRAAAKLNLFLSSFAITKGMGSIMIVKAIKIKK